MKKMSNSKMIKEKQYILMENLGKICLIDNIKFYFNKFFIKNKKNKNNIYI